MNGIHKPFIENYSHHVLIVEDEPDLANLIKLNLNTLNYGVEHCTTLKSAREMLLLREFNLILIDRMLPDGDGIMLCQQLRESGVSTPCMILTAKDSEADIVLGLEAGADDYMIKPFSVLELRARVKALLRRCKPIEEQQESQLDFDGITINCATREVVAFEIPLELTAREFDLLLFMAKHPKQVFSRMQLLEAVWGYSYTGYEHTVNSHINRLRAKLSHCSSTAELVKTVWGVGYKFTPPIPSASH